MIMNFQSMIMLLHGMVVSDQWSGLPNDGSHIKCSAQFDHSFSEYEPVMRPPSNSTLSLLIC